MWTIMMVIITAIIILPFVFPHHRPGRLNPSERDRRSSGDSLVATCLPMLPPMCNIILLCPRAKNLSPRTISVPSVYVHPTRVRGGVIFFLLFVSAGSNKPIELALYRIGSVDQYYHTTTVIYIMQLACRCRDFT